jgi:hypothetical protein
MGELSYEDRSVCIGKNQAEPEEKAGYQEHRD